MTTEPVSRMLDRKEAASYCGLSPNSFDKYIEVPPLRFGKRKLWDRVALDRYLDRRSGLNAGSSRFLERVRGNVDKVA